MRCEARRYESGPSASCSLPRPSGAFDRNASMWRSAVGFLGWRRCQQSPSLASRPYGKSRHWRVGSGLSGFRCSRRVGSFEVSMTLALIIVVTGTVAIAAAALAFEVVTWLTR
jgi:hypothetical protein